MAGWIGVEISRSRVRTPGKAGYGLYRVRGTGRWWVAGNAVEPGPRWISEPREWTPYAFRLDVIERAVRNSLAQGRPERPIDLAVGRSDLDGAVFAFGERGPHSGSMVHLTTRWTQAYRGRRDLGAPGREVPAGDSLGEQPHDPQGCRAQGRPHLGPCSAPPLDASSERSTVRSRQRAANAAFQKAHLERRVHGKRTLHARKLRHLGKTQPGRTQE